MKIRYYYKIVLVCLVIGFTGAETFAQAEIFAPIKELIKAGSSKDMVKYLNQSVDMNLDGEVNTYSKTQAEFALRDFFKKHPPKDFSIVHTGSSKGGLQFAIGRYLSNGESYSALIRLKEVSQNYLIHEINFVKE
ncbi:MAG: DUF4783 domain-containing protein [Bacteroidia bacterium]|nr:DUF4783 domain-containing protein [Bacteroidia bacterium]